MPAERESAGSPGENRKNSKPVMEKRRRARINASLCELKSLLLEVMKKEGARHNKMEKADILEMTVKHLRQIQRQQFAVAATSDPSVVTKYQSGFAECAHEVTRYLSNMEGVDVNLKSRMLSHLSNSIQGVMGRNAVTSSQASSTSPQMTSQSNVVNISIAPKVANPMVLTPGLDCNNNLNGVVLGMPTSVPAASPPPPPHAVASTGSPQKIISGVQLVPTRLPGGEMAFVLPNNVLSTGHVPSYVIPVYSGAPTVVSGATTTQAAPSLDVTMQPLIASGLPLTTTGSGQSAVLPAVVLPSVGGITNPCLSPDPMPMNLTSSQAATAPSVPLVTTQTPPPELTLKKERAPSPGSHVVLAMDDREGGEEDREKFRPLDEDDGPWRPW